MRRWWWQGMARRLSRRLVLGMTLLLLVSSLQPLHAQAPLSCGELVYPVGGPSKAPTVTPGTNLLTMGDAVYFISRDESGAGTDPRYLWRTDGTPTGTFTITAPATDFSPLYLFATINDKLILRATTPTTGAELWLTDGTTQGTQLLKDMTPGPDDTTYQSSWFELDNRLFFGVYEEGKNSWWTTSGTITSTVPLTTIYPGPQPENLYLLAQNSTEAYFASTVSTKQVTLWRLDADGFQVIKELVGDEQSSDITTISAALIQQGKLYFFAKVAGGPSGLWRSNGTAAGTRLLVAADLLFPADQNGISGLSAYTLLASDDETLFFFEVDKPLLKLWRLDTLSDKATLVKTIRARSEDGLYYELFLNEAVTYDQQLYFSFWWRDNRQQFSQTELWQSDGTEAGTRFFTNLRNGGMLAFGTPFGLFLLNNDEPAGSYVLNIPWQQPYPTVVCNLGAHSMLYPKLFRHQDVIYVSGRNAYLGTVYLWRLDPATLQPTNIFVPVAQK